MAEAPIPIAMTPDEVEMLARRLTPGVRYLEFGCGGTTLFALERGVARCCSVENDPAWVEKLRAHPDLARAEAEGRLVFHLVEMGPLMNWGVPANASAMPQWPAYYLGAWPLAEPGPEVVLIDGRFRVACAMAALALCPPSTAIFLHDFFEGNPMRRNYPRILEVAEIVERTNDLVRLERRAGVTTAMLLARLGEAWTDFG
jgi:hypothetical protein